MEGQEIFSLIRELETDVFSYQLDSLPLKFGSLSAFLQEISPKIPANRQQQFHQVLLTLLQSYENKDYLMLADTLEFELRNLIVSVLDGDNAHGNI